MARRFPKRRSKIIPQSILFMFNTGRLSFKDVLMKWINENRDILHPGWKDSGRIVRTYRDRIVKKFNKALFDDILYNKAIYQVSIHGPFLFFAQKKESDRAKKFYPSNGMYSVELVVYYPNPLILNSIKPIFKTTYLPKHGKIRKMLKKAIREGHRYPRQEEVIIFIHNHIKKNKDELPNITRSYPKSFEQSISKLAV